VAITFEPKDSAVGGSTGVNSFSGTWSREVERMVIHPGAMTMMAGPERLMEQEAAFIRALREVRAWRIAGEALELLSEDQVILKFHAGK
jgi:heat shock protein HslJ